MIEKIALGAGLTGLLFALVGIFVILRRMSFIGAGLSHAAFGGAGIGLALNINPLLSAALYTSLISPFIQSIGKWISKDAAIGIIFAFSMALGIIGIFYSNTYSDAMALLFGSILGISWEEVLLMLIISAFILAWFYRNWKVLYYSSFDEEFCKARGEDTEKVEKEFLIIVALAIVIGMKMVGALLVSAFMIIPPSTALMLKLNIRKTLIASILFSFIAISLGIVSSFAFDIPTGATIILWSTLLLLMGKLIKNYGLNS